MPDELRAAMVPLLLPEPTKPKDGRPRCDDRLALAGIIFVLRSGSVQPRIARRGVETSDRLGRHRCVVERTIARLDRFLRLAILRESRADIHDAVTTLGCDLSCLNQIRRFSQMLLDPA